MTSKKPWPALTLAAGPVEVSPRVLREQSRPVPVCVIPADAQRVSRGNEGLHRLVLENTLGDKLPVRAGEPPLHLFGLLPHPSPVLHLLAFVFVEKIGRGFPRNVALCIL